MQFEAWELAASLELITVKKLSAMTLVVKSVDQQSELLSSLRLEFLPASVVSVFCLFAGYGASRSKARLLEIPMTATESRKVLLFDCGCGHRPDLSEWPSWQFWCFKEVIV